MNENYEPELGQFAFGQPYKRLGVPINVKTILIAIRGVMEENSKTDFTPFDNSGERFKNNVFECISYDWSDNPQPYNFKWKDFEVSWYKYLGRGMSMNRKIENKELYEMLSECLFSLL